MKAAAFLLSAIPLFAAGIPAGTELQIRLLDKVQSEALAPAAVHAVLIAPLIAEGNVAVPAGVHLSGTVKSARAAAANTQAQIELSFTEMSRGKDLAKISAIVSAVDNARETVDEKGLITGIDASQSFGTRLDQGIAKLEANDKLALLAGILSGAKQTLNIKPVNANIDYDAGTELTLKLFAPFEWTGATPGAEAKLIPFPHEEELLDLVIAQPFRTVAVDANRPSDMTNLMFVATEEDLRAAFTQAGWSSAARLSAETKLETARALIEDRGYREGPMSVLLLNGKPPDFSLQKGNNTFAQRHHLRIFRRPGTFAGKPIWVCSSTHDTGISYSDNDRTFIHRIDPEIDRERAKVVNDLLFTGFVRSIALVDRPAVPMNATNATGDRLKTDGRMAVLLF